MNDIVRQRSEIINSALAYINKSTILCKEYFDEDEMAANLQELNNCVEQYCIQDLKFSAFNRALEQTEESHRDPEKMPSASIEKTFRNIHSKEEINLSKEAISRHPYMVQYVRETEQAELEKEVENADDDIVATNDFSPPIDPITKTVIKNPVRNTQCGHVYENDSIRALMSKKNTRCPYIGCPANQYIQISNLKIDHKLKKKIDDYLFKQY